MRHAHLLAAGTIILGLPLTTQAQDLPETSPVAIGHHQKGVELYVKDQYADAIPHFYRAFEADPTFYVSLFMAGLTHGNLGQVDKTDSLYRIVAQHRDLLSPYYRNRLESQMAIRSGDRDRAIELMRRTVELAPGTKAAYNLALFVAGQNRPGEAIRALRTLDPSREPMRGWFSYYSVYAGAAHALGEYEDELRIARLARAAMPDDIRTANLEIDALATLGRVEEMEAALNQASRMNARGAVTMGALLRGAGQELAAHGHADAAKPLYARALHWYDALPSEQALTQVNRNGRGFLLYVMGRMKESAAVNAALAREFPTAVASQIRVGYYAGLLGDRKTAAEMDARVASGAFSLNPTNIAIWRATLALGVGRADDAIAHFNQAGARLRWMHLDPVIQQRLGKNPAWIAFLKPSDSVVAVH